MKILIIKRILTFCSKISFIIDCVNIKKIKLHFLYLFFLSILNFIFDMISLFSIFPLIILLLDKEKFTSYLEKYDILNYINNIPENELIFFLAFSIFFLAALKLLVVGYFHFYKNKLFITIQLKLSSYLLDMYLKSSYKIIISKPIGKIITNIKNECERINLNLRNFIDFSLEFLTLSVIGTLILFVNFQVAIFFILFLLLISFLFSSILKKYNFNIGSVRTKYMALVTRYLLQAFNGIKTIKVSGTENKVTNLFSDYDQNIGEQDIKFNTFQSFPKLFFEFISIITLLAIIIYVSTAIENKSSMIEILTLCAICGFRVLPAFSRIHVNLQAVGFTANSINNIFNEIKKNQSNQNIKKEYLIKRDVMKDDELININSLTFAYTNTTKNLLEDISFSIKKGEKIAIIGETGSGKSTLLDIILGLLEPSKGEVVVNSASLLSSLDLSRFYSYVPQQPFLIDGTIFQNIIFGKEDRLDIQRDDNIISALEKSCCKEFVDKLEDGLEATVGENGIKLSLGQRQRLSLARALYRNSKLLVMDEPTSALDPKIEEEVILNLCKYSKDITIIMVTHKYDILKKFDTVYKLEHKKLIKVKKI